MRRGLDGPVAKAQWPASIIVAPFSLRQATTVHGLLSSGYQDGSGSVAQYAEWLSAFEHDPEFNPSLCFLAMHEGIAVGVVACWTSAFIKDLVVHADYRHRGIGTALLNHLFAHLRQQGEGCVDLKVVENNLGARRLYEKSGMSYVSRLPVVPV
ncbi:GNAT family N-acetyltransferase [Pseudomonas floridensis]|uniref:GNAT family N-acetyltransferase n=1 Tax=Pseudomonas floridensis TaxID=1958950 RepID=A0A1X0N9B2_9PSED|nr:GNAT family N-acetyltransferase [Pseudomonas floridensis]ORC59726.1 GNAT family N-acetyltransferase [Pseudomonas floridensis]